MQTWSWTTVEGILETLESPGRETALLLPPPSLHSQTVTQMLHLHPSITGVSMRHLCLWITLWLMCKLQKFRPFSLLRIFAATFSFFNQSTPLSTSPSFQLFIPGLQNLQRTLSRLRTHVCYSFLLVLSLTAAAVPSSCVPLVDVSQQPVGRN